MIYLLAFVALVLASARATRVIVYDDVALPLRSWVLAERKKFWLVKVGPTPRLSKLVRCYWCSGFWISALGAAATHSLFPWSPWISIPLLTFATSYAVGVLLDKEGTDGI